ncbi:uncharacterized protein LOC129399917 [Sorex araneus]|uniref:uncharacterized protein LOC129399917 n=1 Tax=Sorex araneus TaxID=42254 RepID=UPI0024336B36|nr:uncharacterized protein LOC129399917 [Sorex araneus]
MDKSNSQPRVALPETSMCCREGQALSGLPCTSPRLGSSPPWILTYHHHPQAFLRNVCLLWAWEQDRESAEVVPAARTLMDIGGQDMSHSLPPPPHPNNDRVEAPPLASLVGGAWASARPLPAGGAPHTSPGQPSTGETPTPPLRGSSGLRQGGHRVELRRKLLVLLFCGPRGHVHSDSNSRNFLQLVWGLHVEPRGRQSLTTSTGGVTRYPRPGDPASAWPCKSAQPPPLYPGKEEKLRPRRAGAKGSGHTENFAFPTLETQRHANCRGRSRACTGSVPVQNVLEHTPCLSPCDASSSEWTVWPFRDLFHALSQPPWRWRPQIPSRPSLDHSFWTTTCHTQILPLAMLSDHYWQCSGDHRRCQGLNRS